jgi:predicted transcriptional regulator of viral defense system
MGDTAVTKPDHECLFDIASEQLGYFTSAQARSCGFKPNLLTFHTNTGEFIRVFRGLYRLRDYPFSPKEEVAAGWLAVGKDKAVVSHSSALDLLDLSDVIPDAVHLTVPRTTRNLPTIPGVKIHTSKRPPGPKDVTYREGIRLTEPTRTILDSAEVGIGPEQIEMAVRQALRRGLTTTRELEEESLRYSKRVQRLTERAIALASS